ncbi:hypothetical protein Tco_0918774 [Tanacetum coccineum]
MDDPNITMEEYIRLEEEKAQRHGKMFNWKTATFRKVENYEDEDDCSIDFETKFPAIVFDNTLAAIPSEPMVCPPNENEVDFRISLDESNNEDYTFKSDLEIKPLVSSERINEFNLIDEASLSKYDEEIVSRFNDLFNIIHPNDSKSEKDNDDNDIGIIQSSEAADQRHLWLRYQIQEYTEGIRHSYEQRLETIWSRPINRVHVLDFEGLTLDIRQDLAVRLRMVYFGEGQMSDTEMGLDVMDTLWLHKEQEMAEAGFGDYWAGSDRLILDKGDLRDYWIKISSDKDFLGPPLFMGQAPEKVTGVDLFYLHSMDRGTTNAPHLLAQYLFRPAEGRKSRPRLSWGHFIGHLAIHFRLVSDEGLRGLQAWVAQGLERQQAAVAGAYKADEAGQVTKEVAQEIPAPAQAPPPPIPAPKPCLRGVVESFITEQYRVFTWLITCMTQLMDASGQTYQPFDSTLVGSLWLSFQRRVKPRIGDVRTSATPHTDAQPDP